MRVKDDREWQQFVTDMKSKNFPPLEVLLNAFIQWTEAVQDQPAGTMDYNMCLTGLPCADQLNAGDIGEMYVIALRFWPEQDSTEFFDMLTLLERKMINENVRAKIALAARYAKEQGEKVI